MMDKDETTSDQCDGNAAATRVATGPIEPVDAPALSPETLARLHALSDLSSDQCTLDEARAALDALPHLLALLDVAQRWAADGSAVQDLELQEAVRRVVGESASVSDCLQTTTPTRINV